MGAVVRNYEEWLAWMRKNCWTNQGYVPPEMGRPSPDDYPMICNAVYNRRHGDYSDVESISLKDFTDEICPLPISAYRVLTDEQLNKIGEEVGGSDYSSEQSISDVVGQLLKHIEFLNGVISDQRTESALYDQGVREGIKRASVDSSDVEEEPYEGWTGTH